MNIPKSWPKCIEMPDFREAQRLIHAPLQVVLRTKNIIDRAKDKYIETLLIRHGPENILMRLGECPQSEQGGVVVPVLEGYVRPATAMPPFKKAPAKHVIIPLGEDTAEAFGNMEDRHFMSMLQYAYAYRKEELEFHHMQYEGERRKKVAIVCNQRLKALEAAYTKIMRAFV